MSNTPNMSAKAVLARMMAMENIDVEISRGAPTASFNMRDRKLVLPLWNVADETYNMLVGHEVSHALYTPAGRELERACRYISTKHPGVACQYINVVEDARIERLIKRDYPGLRRSFADGYRELKDMDLFGLKGGKAVADRPLLDRINLQYKIGWILDVIPFTKEELVLARKVAETSTWNDVVELSKEIYEFVRQEQDADEQAKNGKGGPKKLTVRKGKPGESGEPGDGPSVVVKMPGKGGKGSPKKGEDEGSSSDLGEQSEDTIEIDENGKASDGSEVEFQDEDGNPISAEEFMKSFEKELESDTPIPGSESQTAMQEGLKKNIVQTDNGIRTVDLPAATPNMRVPFKDVEDAMGKILSKPGATEAARALFSQWARTSTGPVNALWAEFERRKAGDAHRRTMVDETGMLDPNRLVHYKTSESVFLSIETRHDGKNHGMVLLLDMSGSMGDKIFATLLQVLNLVDFARRSSIPFVVYGFTDLGSDSVFGKDRGPVGWKERKNARAWNGVGSNTRLVTLMESGMNKKCFNTMGGGLLLWALSLDSNKYNGYSSVWGSSISKTDAQSAFSNSDFRLSSTPTNVALLALSTYVMEFKHRHNVQIVNTVVLTDGEATDSPLTSLRGSGSALVLRDPDTKIEYRSFGMVKSSDGSTATLRSYGNTEQQALLASIVRDRTGGSVMLVSLVAKTHGGSGAAIRAAAPFLSETTVEQSVATLNKAGWVFLPAGKKDIGFTHVAALKVNSGDADDDNPLNDVETGTKNTGRQLTKAYAEMRSKGAGTRLLMTKMGEVFSKSFLK